MDVYEISGLSYALEPANLLKAWKQVRSSMDYRLRKLAEYIRGWMGYFRITEYYRPIPQLDQWIRRRIRCCFIKQWRKPKTRYRNLIRSGVDHIKAALIATSSKGYYRLSKTWACFVERLMDQVSPSLVNRPVRTRMPGGVGWRLKPLATRFMRIYLMINRIAG